MKTSAPTLITGVAGFIGFHLAKRLLREGEWVVGVDNLNGYYSVELKHARLGLLRHDPAFEFVRLDIEDRESMDRLFTTYDFSKIVHLAAQAGVGHSLHHPHAYVGSNIVGFLHVLEGARQSRIEHLVFASSSSVYGANTRQPFSAHRPADHPLSLYAASKRSNELMAHAYASLHGVPVTGIRFFTVYGPWGRPDMALFLFTEAILNGRPIDIYNHGQMRRHFTYIDDAVEAALRILRCPPTDQNEWTGEAPDPATSSAPYRIYDVAGPESVSVLRLVELLEASLGRKAAKRFLPMRPGDVRDTSADLSDLEGAFGFKPRISVEAGVQRFVEWYFRQHAVEGT